MPDSYYFEFAGLPDSTKGPFLPFSEFLYDLSLVLGASALATLLCRQFKQPVVIGYIITGFLIGPHLTKGLIRNEETIHTLSQLGIVFLLFSLGMEFHLGKLKQVGAAAFIATTLEITILVAAGYLVGRAFGWSQMDSIFLGALISISSTTITLKALSDLGRSKDRFAEIIIGILIIEDLLAVVLIAILSGIGASGTVDVSKAFWELARLSAFVSISLVLGYLGGPKLIHFAARFRSDEMLIILALGSCFAFSLFTMEMGYSVALGAFLIGIVFGEARQAPKIRVLLSPIRDMFCAIFFVSVGLLIQPASMVEHTWAIVVLTLVIVAGKVLTCAIGTFLAGHSMRESTMVGMGKAQIGEFSFIIAGMGLTQGVTSEFLYPIAVSLSVITTLITPYLIRGTDGMIRHFENHSPSFLIAYYNIYTRWVNEFKERSQDSEAKRALMKTLGRLLLLFLLIAGGLVFAAFAAQKAGKWMPAVVDWKVPIGAVFWIATLGLALPLFIKGFHDFKALGLLFAELGISETRFRTRKTEVAGIIANGTILIGAVMLAAWIALFSAALLNRRDYPIAVAGMLVMFAYFQRHAFIRLYQRSKEALDEVFTSPETDEADEAGHPAPRLFDASLVVWTISAKDPCAGKQVGETALRSRTGASIVGIERKGVRLVNPGPDEEIQSGDRILVFGDESQLREARTRLLAQ